jgi:hypothetical protein
MKLAAIILATIAIAGIATAAGYFIGDPKDAAIRAAAIGLLTTLVVGGGLYLTFYTLAMRSLEAVATNYRKSQRAVHYKSGNPRRFWEAVGGQLYLSSDTLEFRSNSMEWWVYQIAIPLHDISRAAACKIGNAPGGLRIERKDGSVELFTFGAALNCSEEWVAMIHERLG